MNVIVILHIYLFYTLKDCAKNETLWYYYIYYNMDLQNNNLFKNLELKSSLNKVNKYLLMKTYSKYGLESHWTETPLTQSTTRRKYHMKCEFQLIIYWSKKTNFEKRAQHSPRNKASICLF